MKHCKIAIIGAGSVGSTTAYALSLKKIAAEIILIDTDEQRCCGEVLDLSDIRCISPSSLIKKGDFTNAKNADIVIIAAGKRQDIHETRTNLYQTNKKIIQNICTQLSNIQPNAIVIVITNPVDPLTRIVQNMLSLPHTQIFGSGTILDSLRLKKLIGEQLAISPQSISAVVLGEHGDSQFIAWSSVHINGIPLKHFSEFSNAIQQEIEQKTKQEAYDIISCKGATFFGVATCVALMCEAIVFNEQLFLPLSCLSEKDTVCFSLPVILGECGITRYVPFQLSEDEEKKLEKSIQFVKQYNV